MKYFKLCLLGDNSANALTKAREYFAYREGILPYLPPDLQWFVRKCSLHDATLKRLDLSVPSRQLTAEFVGNHYAKELAPEESVPEDYYRRFRLTYHGVQVLHSPGNPAESTPAPHGTGVGDLVYDEIELIRCGEFEHRMLFATGFELHVRFTDFSVRYEDCEFNSEA